MKCSFSSAILCFVSLAAAEYLQDNLFNIALRKRRNFNQRVGLSHQQLTYPNTATHSRLSRRANSPPGRQSPQRQRQRQQANNIAQTNAQSSLHGPGMISAGQNPAPRLLENVERQMVPQGRYRTLQTSHNVGSFASAQPRGSPPPDAAQQAAADHPGKASSQGQKALGIVTAPVGGRGYMKLKLPEREETHRVLGGQSIMDSVTGRYPGDAKAEVSVTRGGYAYTASHVSPGSSP